MSRYHAATRWEANRPSAAANGVHTERMRDRLPVSYESLERLVGRVGARENRNANLFRRPFRGLGDFMVRKRHILTISMLITAWLCANSETKTLTRRMKACCRWRRRLETCSHVAHPTMLFLRYLLPLTDNGPPVTVINGVQSVSTMYVLYCLSCCCLCRSDSTVIRSTSPKISAPSLKAAPTGYTRIVSRYAPLFVCRLSTLIFSSSLAMAPRSENLSCLSWYRQRSSPRSYPSPT